MAGTVAEWYEFFLYGMAAALVFGDVFFKATGNPLDGVIAALLTYAIASSPVRSVASSSDTTATSSAARSCCRSRFWSSVSRPS